MRTFFRWIGKLIGLALAVALLSLAYLHVRGFPPAVMDFLVNQLARAGVAARFDGLRLDLYRGIVATNAVLADARTPDRPLIQIDEVQLQFSPRRLWERTNPIVGLKIANATVSVPTPPDALGPAAFTAQGAYATFRFEDDGAIRVDRLTGLYCGIRLHVRGRVLPARAAGPATKPSFAFVTRIVRELNRIQTDAAPQLDVQFDLDLAQPLAGRAAVRLQGVAIDYRDLAVAEARVDVRMADGAIEIRECAVAVARGEIKLTGHYDIARGRFDLHLRSTADPLAFAVFAPPEAAPVLRELQTQSAPTLDVRYTLSPDTGSLPQLQGTVQTGALTVRGVEFRTIGCRFENQGPVVKLTDVVIVTPEGQLTGAGLYHIESSDFSYQFDSTLDPVKLLPLMTGGMRRIVEPAAFPGPPPHIVARVQGDFVDPDNFGYEATVTAAHCRYRGVELRAAAGRLMLRDQQLTAQDVRLERPEGTLTGALQADFRAQRVTFELTTTANPSALAPLLGEKAAQTMRPYRFGPRTLGAAAGLIDFKHPGATAWTARVENEGFQYWKLTATRARADLTLTNNHLRIAGFNADFYGGKLVGHAEFPLSEPPGEFQIQLEPAGADVQLILCDIRGKESETTGQLTGRARLTGRGTDLAALAGGGDLQIAEGILWELPLFGIFSRILDDISPGLGKTKANSAKATFTVRNQGVHSDDLEVAAGAFTLKSRGKIEFDGKLDFRVQAHFLKSVPLINIPTAVLGKVLEYKVGGTLGDPSYRPAHLPKEILPHD